MSPALTETIEWDSPEQRNDAWFAVMMSTPRDLSLDEYAAVMPPRGPTGSTQNLCRGVRIRMLNNRGFTVNGKRIA